MKNNFNLKGSKIFVLSVCSGLLAIASIYMTIESSTNGAEFASLQNKEIELVSNQNDLQQKLVEALSVNTLQEQSLDLGFTKVSNLVYISDSDSADSVAVAKIP